MPRRLRQAMGGLAYHVFNRAVGRSRIFLKDADYVAFEGVLAEAWERMGMRICAYCLMPNHWHLVLWPREDGELSEFMRWLTVTHAQRCRAHRGTSGTGPVYEGRFRSFPIQRNDHFLTVCRYVESNALRAGLVERAEAWRWGSLWRRLRPAHAAPFLLRREDWPVAPPRNWLAAVNRPLGEGDLVNLRTSTRRGTPFGDARWQERTADRLGLESSLRPRGRPRKVEDT